MKILSALFLLSILSTSFADDLPARQIAKGDRIKTTAELKHLLTGYRLDKKGEPFYKKIRSNTKLHCFVSSEGMAKHTNDAEFHTSLDYFYEIPENLELNVTDVIYTDGSRHQVKIYADSTEFQTDPEEPTIHKIKVNINCRRDYFDFKIFTNNEIMISEIENAFEGKIKFQ